MPVPTPFHPRTSALCTSLLYKEWAGCHAVRSYDTCHEREYFAFRHSAGLLDVTPLYKYDVRGPDAGRFLSRLMVRDFTAQKHGLVRYVCWCDDRGKVLDDGTVTRLDDEHYRVTSADPNLRWFERNARGMRVEIEDVSRRIAALALQGPRSRAVLRDLVGAPIDDLRFFRAMRSTIDGSEVLITRTGYTGDLGFEIWVQNEGALPLWDALVEAGRPHGLLPAGLDALDVARIEAGFILMGVDYFSAKGALIPPHLSSPFEIGLDWMIQTDREAFIGRDALIAEERSGAPRRLVGIEIDWGRFEELYDAFGLPPDLPAAACREGVPVYCRGRHAGQATSRTWSPTLKKYIALATLRSDHASVGTELEVEVTVEYRRLACRARVVDKPFFDPERKKA